MAEEWVDITHPKVKDSKMNVAMSSYKDLWKGKGWKLAKADSDSSSDSTAKSSKKS